MSIIEFENVGRSFKIPRRNGNIIKFIFSRQYDIKKLLMI
jgi:hypothetical protein